MQYKKEKKNFKTKKKFLKKFLFNIGLIFKIFVSQLIDVKYFLALLSVKKTTLLSFLK